MYIVLRILRVQSNLHLHYPMYSLLRACVIMGIWYCYKLGLLHSSDVRSVNSRDALQAHTPVSVFALRDPREVQGMYCQISLGRVWSHLSRGITRHYRNYCGSIRIPCHCVRKGSSCRRSENYALIHHIISLALNLSRHLRRCLASHQRQPCMHQAMPSQPLEGI
jgi:hypothetical protein